MFFSLWDWSCKKDQFQFTSEFFPFQLFFISIYELIEARRMIELQSFLSAANCTRFLWEKDLKKLTSFMKIKVWTKKISNFRKCPNLRFTRKCEKNSKFLYSIEIRVRFFYLKKFFDLLRIPFNKSWFTRNAQRHLITWIIINLSNIKQSITRKRSYSIHWSTLD